MNLDEEVGTAVVRLGRLYDGARINGDARLQLHVLRELHKLLATRKVAFRLRGRAPAEGDSARVTITLRRGDETIDSAEVSLRVREPEQTQKRTFLSRVDGSVQYYGFVPASGGEPRPGLILTLHGAGVEGIGQAEVYAPKPWAHVVAPTNRRPFGFDWEDWGRLDAIEVLDLALEELGADPSRVVLTGHSMGGHGTWHLGATFPDRFAAIAPSAGWISMSSYADAVADLGRALDAPQSPEVVPGRFVQGDADHAEL